MEIEVRKLSKSKKYPTAVVCKFPKPFYNRFITSMDRIGNRWSMQYIVGSERKK